MTLKASTGLRNKILDTGSLKSTMALGFINIYAGTVPADADASIGSATLLCTISNNSTGTGLTLDTAAAGVLPKTSSETWSGVNAASGTASFYRHVAVGDDGTASTTQARLQGSVATSGAELNLTSTALSSGATQNVDFYSINLPTL
jgi:hypothetical protein